MTRYEQAFRRIARTLSRLELARSRDEEEDAALDPAMLLGPDRRARKGPPKFLDFYGTEGLELAFERYGLWAAIARRGFPHTSLSIRVDDERHYLFVDAPAPSGGTLRLIELVVRRDTMLPEVPTGMPPLPPHVEVLTIDWLQLENPLASFSPERPRLPGQSHPGLGVGWRVLTILCRAVERLGLAGLVTVADHLHNAEHYARELPFFDPAYAGRLRALLSLLREKEGLSVAQASWALEWGFVSDGAGERVHWRGEAQVWPESEALQSYFRSPTYGQLARVAEDACRFRLDRPAFDARWVDAERSGELTSK